MKCPRCPSIHSVTYTLPPGFTVKEQRPFPLTLHSGAILSASPRTNFLAALFPHLPLCAGGQNHTPPITPNPSFPQCVVLHNGLETV